MLVVFVVDCIDYGIKKEDKMLYNLVFFFKEKKWLIDKIKYWWYYIIYFCIRDKKILIKIIWDWFWILVWEEFSCLW